MVGTVQVYFAGLSPRFSRLTVFRVDFIENARLCCINFVEHKHEIIYHAAGWHAFRSWILVS